jgi:hypothetical protein
MFRRVGMRSSAPRAAVVCSALALLAGSFGALGCGSTGGTAATSEEARLDAETAPPAGTVIGDDATNRLSSACAATVLSVLEKIAERIYREGVFSERTASATYMVGHSRALRRAVERGDPASVRAAAHALLATHHMTDIEVTREGRVLTEIGAAHAIAPLHGSIAGGAATPSVRFVTTVWADSGFVDETEGLAQGPVAIRRQGRTIAGSVRLPSGPLPARGTLMLAGVSYRYVSFPIALYPAGHARAYLLRPTATIAPLCARSATQTTVNTISHVAALIYTGEQGPRALVQVRRAQHNRPLLQAVAHHRRETARLAIDALLNEHIVRIRVDAGGALFEDVGGPHVLAPLRAPLRWGGRQVGTIVLSVQDDLGYLKLAQRLAGVKVVMHDGSQLVLSSFPTPPANLPASGPLRFDGHAYRVFTLYAEAFPAGRLRISELVPIPFE